MGDIISEETGISLTREMRKLTSELSKFNDMFCHIEKKKKVQKDIKRQSEKVSEALSKHL